MKKAIFIFLLLFAYKVNAAEADLVISEIMYDAEGSDNNHEWIEVYNGGEELDFLEDWKFNDGSNHAINFHSGSTTISPGEFFIIADSAEDFLVDYPDYTGTVFDTAMSLTNSGLDIALVFEESSVEASYDGSWGSGDGYSLEKINLTQDASAGNWQESEELGGSPGFLGLAGNSDANDDEENDIELPYPKAVAVCPDKLKVNEVGEFDASQSRAHEVLWEFGPNNSQSTTTVHWFDQAGKYLVVLTAWIGEVNTHDACMVLVEEGRNIKPPAKDEKPEEKEEKIAEQIIATDKEEEIEVSSNEAAPNIFTPSQLIDFSKGDKIIVVGVALHASGENRSLYLADPDMGAGQLVEIYSHNRDFPVIEPGELIEVSGEISKTEPLVRLKISSQEQVVQRASEFSVGELESLEAEELSDDFLYSFISVRGKVIKKSGSNIYLGNETGEELVRVYYIFDQEDLEISKGKEIIATGLLSEVSGKLKLEVLNEHDIKVSTQVLGEKEIEDVSQSSQNSTSSTRKVDGSVSNSEKKKYIEIGVVSLLLIIGFIVWRKKLTNNR